jgi:hypothetical protein
MDVDRAGAKEFAEPFIGNKTGKFNPATQAQFFDLGSKRQALWTVASDNELDRV